MVGKFQDWVYGRQHDKRSLKAQASRGNFQAVLRKESKVSAEIVQRRGLAWRGGRFQFREQNTNSKKPVDVMAVFRDVLAVFRKDQF